MQNSMLKLKLTVTLVLTLTDTGGAVLTLMLGYSTVRSCGLLLVMSLRTSAHLKDQNADVWKAVMKCIMHNFYDWLLHIGLNQLYVNCML